MLNIIHIHGNSPVSKGLSHLRLIFSEVMLLLIFVSFAHSKVNYGLFVFLDIL
jgi:hypothetical protein